MAISNTSKNYISERVSALLGLGTETIGKTQARQEFLPMVDDLQKHPRTIEITDRNNPVAVLLSYEYYAALVAQLSKLTQNSFKKQVDLRGSVTIVGDLEAASKEIAEEFAKSIERSSAKL
jgi:prevent-host-death family protein